MDNNYINCSEHNLIFYCLSHASFDINIQPSVDQMPSWATRSWRSAEAVTWIDLKIHQYFSWPIQLLIRISFVLMTAQYRVDVRHIALIECESVHSLFIASSKSPLSLLPRQTVSHLTPFSKIGKILPETSDCLLITGFGPLRPVGWILEVIPLCDFLNPHLQGIWTGFGPSTIGINDRLVVIGTIMLIWWK